MTELGNWNCSGLKLGETITVILSGESSAWSRINTVGYAKIACRVKAEEVPPYHFRVQSISLYFDLVVTPALSDGLGNACNFGAAARLTLSER